MTVFTKNSGFKIKIGEADGIANLAIEPGGMVVVRGEIYWCDRYGWHKLTASPVAENIVALNNAVPLTGTLTSTIAQWKIWDTVAYNTPAVFTPEETTDDVTVLDSASYQLSMFMNVQFSVPDTLLLELRINDAPAPTQFEYDISKNSTISLNLFGTGALTANDVLTIWAETTKSNAYSISQAALSYKKLG